MLFLSPESIFPTMIDGASASITFSIKLLAMYTVWLSVSGIFEKTGASDKLAKLFSPITKRLFKGEDETTRKYITMNLVSNMLGMNGAATPLGIKAVERMQNGKRYKKNTAMLIVINSTSLQLLPASVIMLRSSFYSVSPSDIILPSLIATAFTTAVGIILVQIIYKNK